MTTEKTTMNGFGNRALVILAGIAVIFLLYWGAPFFIPLLVGLLISYALSPVVDLLTKVLRYRVLSAAIVLATVIALVGMAAWTWSDDVQAAWDKIPAAAKTISKSLTKMAQGPSGPVAEMKKAAAEIETAAQTGKAPDRTPAPAPAAAPSTGSFWSLVWTGWKGVMVAAGQVMVVIFLVFFMLASGDLFKRKLVKILGNTLSQKKITVQMIDEIDAQIHRYLVVLLVSNVLVGVGTWIAFRVMGVEYAELWGLIAGILHTAPYFGPGLIAFGTLIGGFLQFGEWPRAFLVSGASVLVASLVGSLFTTWLASRQTRMNTTASFIGLLFFGWIWGIWGLLLGIPLLAIVKTVCDHYEAWHPVAELLGE
ncbi:MAG: AI-2E family transporter [Usitatibacter sp.]